MNSRFGQFSGWSAKCPKCDHAQSHQDFECLVCDDGLILRDGMANYRCAACGEKSAEVSKCLSCNATISDTFDVLPWIALYKS